MFTYIVIDSNDVVIQRITSSVEYSKGLMRSEGFIAYDGPDPLGHFYVKGELGARYVPEPVDAAGDGSDNS